MYLILHESDQKRFGCPERLPVDVFEISIVDLCELAGRFNFDVEDWPDPIVGEVAFADAGNPDAKRKRPPWAMWAAVWMALRQNDFDVSWDEAGKAKTMLVRVMAEEEESGKDPEPSAEPSMTPPSESSTD